MIESIGNNYGLQLDNSWKASMTIKSATHKLNDHVRIKP